MRRPVPLLVVLTVLGALPVHAQDSLAPIRFGVTWSRGTPQGDLADIADAPNGFTAQLGLPVSRTARVGIRAEFSVLTFPERTLQISSDESASTATVTVRGTQGFTGAGPRIEVGRGRLWGALGVMGGFVRVITDATARADIEGDRSSASLSLSDYAIALKAAADVHLAIYCGPGAACLGLVGGVDYVTGGKVAYPRVSTFRLSAPGELTLDRPAVSPTMLGIRAGVGIEF
jgi:hypothetical protein